MLSCLTARTVITVQMYAERKGWPLESTQVKTIIVSEGPEGCVIAREVHYLGSLSEAQKTRLTEIANKCPLHKLLTSNIEIQTKQI
jgi:putative redox protein